MNRIEVGIGGPVLVRQYAKGGATVGGPGKRGGTNRFKSAATGRILTSKSSKAALQKHLDSASGVKGWGNTNAAARSWIKKK